MLMIIIGLFTLVMALLEHRRDLRVLRALYPDIPASRATWLAALISVLGIAALLGVIFSR
jgi:hypothetical protein